MAVENLPREVYGRKQVVKRRKGSTSTHAVDMADTKITQTSSLSEYDPPIGTYFPHTETLFTPLTVSAFRGHFSETPTLIPVFDYMSTTAPSSTMPDTLFHRQNEF